MSDDSGARESGGWVELATYSSAFEADYAVETLGARGIRARSQGNDTVGIFGPGFQGSTPQGVRVLVQAEHLTAAKEALVDAGP
jgi:hypothetical protein